MLSAKAKRYGVNALLGALLIGAPVFGTFCLYPVASRNRSDVAELAQAQATLGRWLRMATLPTETRIESEQSFKAGLVAEYERVRSYYQTRDAMLQRPLLESYTNDPVRAKLKYAELKRQLEVKGRYAGARGAVARPFMPEHPWEQPAKTPSRGELKLIERRACIADVLVGLLAGSGPTAVQHIAIGEPVAPAAGAGDADPEKAVLRYNLWPVTVELQTQFRQVAIVVDKLITPPASYPCILIRGMDLSATEGGQANVKLTLAVLDFR